MITMHRGRIMEQSKVQQVVETEDLTSVFRRVTRSLSNSIGKTATAVVNLQAVDSTTSEAYEKFHTARGQLERLRLLFCEEQAVLLTVTEKLKRSGVDSTGTVDELQTSWLETSTKALMFIKKAEELVEKYKKDLKLSRKNSKFVDAVVNQNEEK